MTELPSCARADSDKRGLRVVHIDSIAYGDALDLQERLWLDVVEGRSDDTLLLLEHPPTITFGARKRPEHLVASPEALATRGIAVFETRRGGDVTCHGPGQTVGYPILHLGDYCCDIHRYVRSLEEVVIRSLATFGISAGRIDGLTGVWVGDEKIAAIGVEVRRWVTRHGFALNRDPDLSIFSLIVPCGIADKGVTSMARLLGASPPRDKVEAELERNFAVVFGDRGQGIEVRDLGTVKPP